MDTQKRILGLIDEMQEVFSNLKINPHKAYKNPYQIYDLCNKLIEELKKRINGK